MRRLKHNFKKGIALVLSFAMVAGLVPAMSGGANTVQAATGTGTEPSVSAYATKTQLMDGTFAPNEEGTAANIGKLVFGKNSSRVAQEWYILGKDEGVSGDNTINRFRSSRLKDVLKTIFATIVKFLVAEGFVSLDVACTDGTKMEVNANRYTFVWGANLYIPAYPESRNSLRRYGNTPSPSPSRNCVIPLRLPIRISPRRKWKRHSGR